MTTDLVKEITDATTLYVLGEGLEFEVVSDADWDALMAEFAPDDIDDALDAWAAYDSLEEYDEWSDSLFDSPWD